jgi:hypothetical protein
MELALDRPSKQPHGAIVLIGFKSKQTWARVVVAFHTKVLMQHGVVGFILMMAIGPWGLHLYLRLSNKIHDVIMLTINMISMQWTPNEISQKMKPSTTHAFDQLNSKLSTTWILWLALMEQ